MPLGLFQVSFKVFAGRPQVHIENGRFQIDVTQFSGDDCFFKAGSATDGGTITSVLTRVSGADTLNEGDTRGGPAVGGTAQFS